MSKNKSLCLNNVTLVAADTAQPTLAARALDISISQCDFGDAILFTNVKTRTGARAVKIPRLNSREDYSLFMLKELAQYITTPYTLVVQWDGYVIDASAWSNTFFEYDYIGAPWPMYSDGMCVGNGGFSLRSRRLMNAIAERDFQFPPGEPEDRLICRIYRRELEQSHGIRFAPVEIANRFSYEYCRTSAPTFGFHGPVNIVQHVDDETLARIASALDERTIFSPEVLRLMLSCCDLRRFSCVKVLYGRYRKIMPRIRIIQWIAQWIQHFGLKLESTPRYVEICEKLISKRTDRTATQAIAQEFLSIIK
jgi:hypothetical protein